jgi:hypothetical protein
LHRFEVHLELNKMIAFWVLFVRKAARAEHRHALHLFA